ncbi:MAG: hypothetical protein QOK18_5908 [Mycobacterium sp.]|jgi:hypothetical protein|nr:hypothetical protein [Mycobacterium sp.]
MSGDPGIPGDSAPPGRTPSWSGNGRAIWHFANTSGRGDLTGHHVGRESTLVTSDDIEYLGFLAVPTARPGFRVRSIRKDQPPCDPRGLASFLAPSHVPPIVAKSAGSANR